MKRIVGLLTRPFRDTVDGLKWTIAVFDRLLDKASVGRLVLLLVSLIILWHLYVPVHELLHVAATVGTGGSIDELALKPRYGGRLLQPLFPFIVPESDFAGQLTRFEVPNRWAYGLVDFAPYLLSLFGLAVIGLADRKRSAVLFSGGLILATAPLMGIPGDYYEMVSLVLTRLGEALDSTRSAGAFITDDPVSMVGQFREAGTMNGAAWLVVALCFVFAAYAAALTFTVQVKVRDAFSRRSSA